MNILLSLLASINISIQIGILSLCFFLLVTKPVHSQVTHKPQPLLVNIANVNSQSFPNISVTVNVRNSLSKSLSGLTKRNFQLNEDHYSEALEVSESSTKSIKADIVFVFDDSGSMEEVISSLKSNTRTFASRLNSGDVDFRLGLVSFKDRAFIHNQGRLTRDIHSFNKLVDALVASGEGGGRENSFDALTDSLTLDFRPGVQRILILITDAPPHTYQTKEQDNRYVTSQSLNQVVSKLQHNSITCYIIGADDKHFRGKGSITQQTGGEWYNITRDFTDIINKISVNITSQYLLTYTTHNPVRDGKWREITVQALSDNKRGQSTSGYQAPGFKPDKALLEKLEPRIRAMVTSGMIDFKLLIEEFNKAKHSIEFFPLGYYKPFLKENLTDFQIWAKENHKTEAFIKQRLNNERSPAAVDYMFKQVALYLNEILLKMQDTNPPTEHLSLRFEGYTDHRKFASLSYNGPRVKCKEITVKGSFSSNSELGCLRAHFTKQALIAYLKKEKEVITLL